MRISELARQTGCHLETIRYYERIGLLPPAERSTSGYRHYGEVDRQRLHFIVHSRGLGFSQQDIRSLLSLAGQQQQTCAPVDALVREHLAQVQAKQRQLARLATELEQLLDGCQAEQVADCRILQALGAPGSSADSDLHRK